MFQLLIECVFPQEQNVRRVASTVIPRLDFQSYPSLSTTVANNEIDELFHLIYIWGISLVVQLLAWCKKSNCSA